MNRTGFDKLSLTDSQIKTSQKRDRTKLYDPFLKNEAVAYKAATATCTFG